MTGEPVTPTLAPEDLDLLEAWWTRFGPDVVSTEELVQAVETAHYTEDRETGRLAPDELAALLTELEHAHHAFATNSGDVRVELVRGEDLEHWRLLAGVQPRLFPRAAIEEHETWLGPELTAQYYTMAGRCSGIPECCIAAFVAGMWSEMTVGRGRAGTANKTGIPISSRGLEASPETLTSNAPPPSRLVSGAAYRQCPRCVARGLSVAIRRCPDAAALRAHGLTFGFSGCACQDALQLLFFRPRSIRRDVLALVERELVRCAADAAASAAREKLVRLQEEHQALLQHRTRFASWYPSAHPAIALLDRQLAVLRQDLTATAAIAGAGLEVAIS